MRTRRLQSAALPSSLMYQLFSILTSEIAFQLKSKRVTEKDVIKDFALWKKTRHKTPTLDIDI